MTIFSGIADRPGTSGAKGESRLLVVRLDENWNTVVSVIVKLFKPGDVLVINDTKVPAGPSAGKKEDTGAQAEVLLLKRLSSNKWEVLVRPGKRLKLKGEFHDSLLKCLILGNTDYGGRIVEFFYKGSFEEVLDKVGVMPLLLHKKAAPGTGALPRLFTPGRPDGRRPDRRASFFT